VKKIVLEILRLLYKAAILLFLKWIRPRLGRILLGIVGLFAAFAVLVVLLFSACGG
jgi:hypothetical protein